MTLQFILINCKGGGDILKVKNDCLKSLFIIIILIITLSSISSIDVAGNNTTVTIDSNMSSSTIQNLLNDILGVGGAAIFKEGIYNNLAITISNSITIIVNGVVDIIGKWYKNCFIYKQLN
ncbi:hypothetical protein ALNOE001_03630 [Candidatus Methanobinarius endosymbioticus]|uniref:Uncharacterized protein n=1 Tax=Candidatus Methanobinarius endosymbioticus TaxID=2006182 RepID=A0A366MDB9_9EURY|nr:hypothetical protein ALNOE001_03630 [Candidatus Methanobinarius endosymbioticus]